MSGLKKENFKFGLDKYITYLNVFQNITIDNNNNFEKVNIEHTKQNLLFKNDLLVTNSSETQFECGMVSTYQMSLPVYLNSFCSILRPINEKNNSIYISFLLRSAKYRNYIIRISQGSTRFNLHKDFYEILMHVPSIIEQEKVLTFMILLDQQIKLLERKIHLTKQRKKYYLIMMFDNSQLLQPKLRFNGFNNEWQQAKIKNLYEITRRAVLPKNLIKKVEKYPVYSSQTHEKGLIGYYNEYLFENAITWTTDGVYAGDVNYRSGKFYATNVCGILKSNKYANQAMATIINKNCKKYVVKNLANPKLMNNTMAQVLINFPEIQEQKEISTFIKLLDQQIEVINNQISIMRKKKTYFLSNMFL